MKINKRSWHYRLIDSVTGNVPNNLCAYFWKTVFCLLAIPIGLFIAGLWASIAVAPFLQLYVDGMEGMALVGAVSDIIILSFILKELVVARREKEYLYKQPSLLGEWIRAKKDKVCPKIEFVGGK